MYLAVLLPSILALFALYKNKLTFPAIILAWILGIIIAYFGGIYTFIALATTFILTIASDKLKAHEKDEKRNIYQIISNVLTSAVCIILYTITKQSMFYVMYFAVIGSSLADTLASGIGSLSPKKPINIFTLKRVKPGSSGGITLLGTTSSILAGIIIGLIYYKSEPFLTNYLLIILMSFTGSLVDSILGISLQAKYICPKCNKEVETKIHCKTKTKKIKGLEFIDNNAVNLFNNIIVFVLTYIFLI